MGSEAKPLKLKSDTSDHRQCECACDIISSYLKSALTICILLSISLVVYTRPTPTRWWLSFSFRGPTQSQTQTQPQFSNMSTDLSHIVFGIAGSASTWERRRHYSKIWWDVNTTRGFVWLDSQIDNYTWPSDSPPYRVSPPTPTSTSTSTGGGGASSGRIARISKGAVEEEEEAKKKKEVRWVVLGDDDTVFFKENLVSVLSRYDHREMWYVGGISESVEQDAMHSYRTGFGGGGLAISYPLASQLATIIDSCLHTYSSLYGSDEKLSACVGDIGVPLTRESGFHQLDIRDDPYGLLAAHPVAPLVSLHHLDYVKPLFPHQSQLDSLKTLQRAYMVDPARTLQQSICYSHTHKWSISVSWGYTVQFYPSLIPSRQLELPLQTFTTWRSWSDGPFVFNTRPLNTHPCHRPILYFLDRAVPTKSRGTNNTLSTSTYKRVAPQDGKVCHQSAYKYAMATVDKITVTAPKMDPADWIKAPRRQCCEIRNGWRLSRTMPIIVRSCKLGESIT